MDTSHCADYVSIISYERVKTERDQLRARVAELEADVNPLKYQLTKTWKAVRAFQDLIEQSQGVYGLHLNGDGAPWETLRKGGQFEEWLIEFDDLLDEADAEAALKEVDDVS